MIRFAMLGSGSKGNATLIEHGSTRILVDCGFQLRETEARLLRLGVEPASLAAVIVTHEPSDHLGGVGRLALDDGTAFPARDLAIFLAAGVIIVSLVLASVALPLLLKGEIGRGSGRE